MRKETWLSIIGCFILGLTALSTYAQTSSNDKQVSALNDDVKQLQDELRRLQRDNIDLQRILLESGVSPALQDNIKHIQDAVDDLNKKSQAGGVSAADIQALQDQIKALQAAKPAVDTTAPAPAAPAAPAATAPAAPAPPQSAIDTAVTNYDNNQADSHSISINIVWTLVTGYLVMFMQAGFAMVETGFTRAKNVAHTMSMNLMVYGLGMLGYWVCGFAIHYGGTGADTSVSTVTTLGATIPKVLNGEFGFHIGDKFFGIAGTKGFFLPPSMLEGGVFTLFLFQMVFMDTTATIPTGALAERWKFLSFAIYGVLVGAIIYPFFGNWVWGGGWLAALGKNYGLGHGHVDFAGSSVVHMQGGVLALVGAKILGPRYGKFNKDGSSNPIPGHNIPMGVVGTFILAFGWFGFNPGSTLCGRDPQIGVIATNTMLASAGGAAAGMIVTWLRFGKPDPSFMCNGMLAGLVAITAPCAFVDSWAAVLIGVVAGVLVVYSAAFIENVLKIDDPVGAVSVHGTCGAWGVLSLGLLANGQYGDGWNGVDGKVKGWITCGDFSQFEAQCIGTLTCFVALYAIGYVVFMLIEKTVGNRTALADEIKGLDIPEMGCIGYQPDLNPQSK